MINIQLKRVIIKILCLKKLTNKILLPKLVKEYVDQLRQDINLYNFPINHKDIKN